MRPRNGAVANAAPPAASIITPYKTAWPTADANEISSPGSGRRPGRGRRSPGPGSASRRRTAVTCPASFSSAIERRACGVEARRSRLPLAASPASVPDSARTGHSPSMTGRKLPTRQERKPPSVSRLIGSPSRPRIAGGSAVRPAMNAWRSSTVANSGAIAVRRPGRDHEAAPRRHRRRAPPGGCRGASCRRSTPSPTIRATGLGRARTRAVVGGHPRRHLRRSDAPRTGRGRRPRGSARG